VPTAMERYCFCSSIGAGGREWFCQSESCSVSGDGGSWWELLRSNMKGQGQLVERRVLASCGTHHPANRE
jgi:hypothetical protein